MFIPKLPPKPPILNQTFIEVSRKDIPKNCYAVLPPQQSDNYGGIFVFNSGTSVSSTASDYTQANTVSYIPFNEVYPSVESELHYGAKRMEQANEIRKI